MEVVILDDEQQVATTAASLIIETITKYASPVLGLATGGTPVSTYAHLVELHKQAKVSFADVTTFNLDEYLGLASDAPQSYRTFMNQMLFEHIDIDKSQTHLPECGQDQDPSSVGPRYEQLIQANGGIDLQILGIGRNGHIGFNEPTSSLSSRTRVKTLTKRTVESNSRYFSDSESQPKLAITMGIGTIMEARKVVLLATGIEKSEAVRESVEGPVSAMWPASILQLHRDVVVLLDRAAASGLRQLEYYDWIQQQKAMLNTGGR